MKDKALSVLFELNKISFKEYPLYLLCPVLAAAFPSLFLYQVNYLEVPPGRYFLSSTVAVLGALIFYMAILTISRKLINSAVSIYFVITAFYSYGVLYDFADPTSFHGLFSSQIIWVLVYLALSLFITIKLNKIKNTDALKTVLRFLAFFILILYVTNIGALVYKSFQKSDSITSRQEIPIAQYKKNEQDKLGFAVKRDKSKVPDIYFIVLDEYASSQTIKDYYDYSNGEFENALKTQGFFVSNSSRTSYDATEFAIAAVLNMKNLDSSAKTQDAYRLIGNNRVSEYLKGLGYHYIHIGSSMEVNKINVKNADLYFNYFQTKRFFTEDDLISKLIDISILRPLVYTLDWTRVQQESVYFSFNKLRESSHLKGPKFVFAHIICPHHPFVFNSEGRPLKISDRKNWQDKNIYRGQYIYVSKLVQGFVNDLLRQKEYSSDKPIVIIQSDHGPRKVPDAPFEERYKVFNAMLLPGVKDRDGFEGISPVDTFARIFDIYF